MQLEKANTEPYYRFHRFHESLSLNMRISIAGLAELRALATANKSIGALTVLNNDGEPWSSNGFRDPDKAIGSSKSFIAQLAVVSAMTAIEDFCTQVKSEHDRYSHFLDGKNSSREKEVEDLEGVSPKALYDRLNWDTAALQAIDPLYDYFVAARNCVVHRSGRASKNLMALAGAQELKECILEWETDAGKKLPSLPVPRVDDNLPLLPRHAILASDVCRRIAIDANQKLIDFLGPVGMAYMAAHHSMFAKIPIRTGARKTPEAILNTILCNRYRVRLQNDHEAVKILNQAGAWRKFRQRFNSSRKQD